MLTTRADVNRTVRRTTLIMFVALLLTTLTYLEPTNPFADPSFDLTGRVGVAAYWIAATADFPGILALGLPLIALVVAQSGVAGKHRIGAFVAIVVLLGVVQGGGAALNEYVIKPQFAVARPNVQALATVPDSKAPSILGISLEDFYAKLDEARSEHLAKILTPTIPLHQLVRQHWIDEPGYSFPSGHSFSAMLFATFFLAMGLTFCSGRRLWFFYLLPAWALAVCVSRPILRVHSTTDIFVGGLEGLVVGSLAFLAASAGVAWFNRRGAVRPDVAMT